MSQIGPSLDSPLDSPRYSPLPIALVCILALLPPETRGEGMAGAAALIGLWVLAGPRRPGAAWAPLVLGLGLLSYFPAALSAQAPGAVYLPISTALLAVAVAACTARLDPAVRRRDTLAWATAAVATVVSLHGLYQRLWGLDRLVASVGAGAVVADRQLVLARASDGRAFAAFPTPAALGGFLALTIPLTLGTALGRRGRWRPILFAFAAVQAVGLLASASATAAAALVASFAMAAWFHGSGRRRWILSAGGALMLVLGVVALRGGQVTDLRADGSPWRLRAANFRIAGEMIRDHPWVGVGAGGFGEAYPAYRRSSDNETQHAHDLPLELTAELGLPLGLMLSVLLFVVLLGPLVRRPGDRPPWQQGAAVGLAALGIQNLVDFSLLLPSLMWLSAVLAGALSEGPRAGTAVASRPRWLGRAATLVAVVVAATVAALAGLAWDDRVAARLEAAAGDRAAAEQRARAATRLAPWNADGWLYLAELVASPAAAVTPGAPEFAAAVESVDRALALCPVRPSAHWVRAELRARSGDLPGAYADAVEAARLYPSSTEYAAARERLGRMLTAYEELGREGP